MTRHALLWFSTALATTSAMALDLTTADFRIPVPRSVVLFPLVVGEARGSFEEQGLRVNPLPLPGRIPSLGLLENGQADMVLPDSIKTLSAVGLGPSLPPTPDHRHGSSLRA